MPEKSAPFHIHEHDWLSSAYVDRWIGEDVTRDSERRPILRHMMGFAPFSAQDPLRILDVGAGYGVVTAEALRAFPQARVTWQDYSQPMLEHAQQRLSPESVRLSFVLSDLTRSDWRQEIKGPFDLVVSGIALHNLRDRPTIFRCYGEIRALLAPGGCFLDYDHFKYAGGVDLHIEAMRKAGYETVECLWQEGPTAILRAR